MKDWTGIRERYLKDDVSLRLGGLAANLARIASFSDDLRHRTAVVDLLDESKRFIEWTTSEVSMEVQGTLVQLQVELARWGVRLETDWQDVQARSDLASNAKTWSETVLRFSGLLEPQTEPHR